VKFRLVHKLTSYLLVATALASLATSESASGLSLAVMAAAATLSWFIEPDTRLGTLFDRAVPLFNVATVAFFALAVLQVARSFPEVDLSPFLDFVFFLLGYKLCQRRNNRDYLQVYILSFLAMLAAAWQATSAVFIVGFFVYVVLATWTLIFFHLRREIEENYLVRHTGDAAGARVTVTRVLNSRRVVGWPFFLTTGLVAVLVFGGAALVFASVPRVGLGFVLGGVRRQTGVAGFSDEVKLGMHGVLSLDNQTVVLRAQVPRIAAVHSDDARENEIASLYWRGTVYDTYENGEWVRSRDERTRTRLALYHSPNNDGRTYVLASPQAPGPPPGRTAAMSGAVEQDIEVVALVHAVAFALDQPTAVEMPPPPSGAFTAVDVEARWSGELGLRMFRVSPFNFADRRTAVPEFSGARYRAYSRLLAVQSGAGVPESQLAPGALAPYLRTAQSLSPRVRELALRLTRDKPDAAAKIDAVAKWLRATHTYTTDLKRDTSIPDPLEDFLFHQSAGHCEYFASAAAMLLRLGGVPTRYVNGFLGGEWNSLRQSITVRDNRAHSWVEAYLGSNGWARVDATPAGGRAAHMTRFRQVIDSVEMFWNRWVIEYSASQQLFLARQLSREFGWMQPHFSPRGKHHRLSRSQVLAVAAVLVALVIVFALRKLPRRRAATNGLRRRQRGEVPIFRVYQKTLDRLAARGFARRPEETPHEYLARVRQQGVAAADALAHLTDCYAEARYGDVEVPPEVVLRLRSEAASIGRDT
jgi:transglutaminase-like putative cysteine protease